MDQLAKKLDDVLTRLDKIEKMVAAGGGPSEPPSVAVEAYDALMKEFFEPLIPFADSMGPDSKAAFKLFLGASDAAREFIVMAAKSKKPKDSEVPKLLKPLSEALQACQNYRDTHRASKEFNQLSVLYEIVPAFGWVSVAPTPAPYVTEMLNAGDFYMNKVLREFKGKDDRPTNWVKGLKVFLKEMAAYVKQHHTTGITWNPEGATAYVPTATGGSASVEATAPPPPPPSAPGPPPPPAVMTSAAASSAPSGGMGAVFASLNKGDAVTTGLKHVSKDMKTKNRPASERSGAIPAKVEKKAPTPAKKFGGATGVAKPPTFELDGKKWRVEYQKNNKNIVIDDTNLKQVVSVWNCEGSVIQVTGKVNSIALTQCKKCGIVFHDVIASVEVVNCKSVQVQAAGKLPLISIEKSDGCQVFVGEKALDAEIISSCSSEINVNFEHKGEPLEFAVPEQFKTIVKDGKIVTEIMKHID